MEVVRMGTMVVMLEVVVIEVMVMEVMVVMITVMVMVSSGILNSTLYFEPICAHYLSRSLS